MKCLTYVYVLSRFGQSIGGRLVVANISWPNEWVILIGSALSSLGAGLQSLTGAPRLLQVNSFCRSFWLLFCGGFYIFNIKPYEQIDFPVKSSPKH